MNTPAGAKKVAEALRAKGSTDAPNQYWRDIGKLNRGIPKSKPSGFAYMKLHEPDRFAALIRANAEKRRQEARGE